MSTPIRTLTFTAALIGLVACGTATPIAEDVFADFTAVIKVDPLRDGDREMRAAHRAFYTAPPIVSHDGASGMSSGECLDCHGEAGLQTPHPQFTNCMQCHVAAESPFGEPVEIVENSFAGLVSPHSIAPVAAETPPSMPHRLALREDCIACHTADSAFESLRTPHPERVNCQQCHVPLAGMEFHR